MAQSAVVVIGGGMPWAVHTAQHKSLTVVSAPLLIGGDPEVASEIDPEIDPEIASRSRSG